MAHYQQIAFAVQLPPMLQRGGFSLTAQEKRDIAEQAGLAVQQKVRDNYEKKNSAFWAEASRSTTLQVTGADEVLVTTHHTGVHLRLKGGVVRPGKGISSKSGKPTSLLALPTEGGKKSPGDFGSSLTFRAVDGYPRLKGVLLPAIKKTAKKKYKDKPAGRTIEAPVYDGVPAAFLLVLSTTHKPDPSVVPSDKELNDAANKGAAYALKWITRTRKKS